MSKLTTVKIKYDNGNLSGQIPIGMEAENVYWNNQETLKDKLGDLDSDSRDVETRLEDAATRIQDLEDADYETKISTAQNGIISLTNKLNNLPYITITSSNHIQKTDKTKIYKENGFLYYWGNGEWQKIRVSDAVGIKNITAGDNYSFNFELTDGRIFNTGSLRGAPGQDVGQKGVGIADVHHNEDNTLTFYFTGNIRVGQEGLETDQFTTESIQGPKGLGIKTIQITPNTSNSLRFIYDEYVPSQFGEANFIRIDEQKYSFQDVPVYIEGGGGGTSGGGTVEEVVSISEIRSNEDGTAFSIYLSNDSSRPAFQSGNLKGEDGVGIASIQWINNNTQLQITLDDDTVTTSGSLAGEDGRGISDVSFDKEDNTLTLNFDKPLEDGSSSYTTPPIGGGGIASINYAIPQNYTDKVQNFNGTDYTQVFKVMLADAKENHKFIIIPNRSYELKEQLWSDDSVIVADLGIYPNKKLIISKDLDDGIPFERAVCEFNPYLDIETNARTTNLNTDRYYHSPFLVPKSKGGTDTAEPNPQPFVRRRLQGVCYDDYHDVFIFGFTEVRNRNSYFAPALLMFFKLNQRNIFEYAGKGYAKYAGHLNSMCFRLEDKTTGDAANDETLEGNKIGCIYAACGLQSNDTIPSASKTKDIIKQGLNIDQINPDDQIGKLDGEFLTDEQVFQVYGGSKFEIARIPIIVNSNGTFGIPTKYSLIHKNPNLSGDFSKTLAIEDGVGYSPQSGSVRAYYDRVHYFCGVISDNIYDNFDTSKFNRNLGSMNRSVYGLTYDDNNNIFYIYTTVFEAMVSGNKIVRFTDNDHKSGIQIAYFKAFTLKDNKWTVVPESERPNIFQSEDPNFNNVQLPFKKGFINVTQTDEQVKNKTQIFADIEHSYDPDKNTFSVLDQLEAQGPIVINDQLVWCYYISKQISNFGRFNNGTLFVQFNYHTGQVKKIYRIPCQYPYHEVQCLVRGKNGRIYMMNQLGKSDTQGNRIIRVTQLVFDKDVVAIPENPYTDPKNLRVYPKAKTKNSDDEEVIDFNYLTEIGSYVFMGNVAHSNSSASKVKADFDKFKIINSPIDSYYFTLYVLSIGGWFRFQILLAEHGQIYIRNGWISDNTGGVGWSGWRQLVETYRASASRAGTWRGAGYLTTYAGESKPRQLCFTIPYSTPILSSFRGGARIQNGSEKLTLVLRQGAGKTTYRVTMAEIESNPNSNIATADIEYNDSYSKQVPIISSAEESKNLLVSVTETGWGFDIAMSFPQGLYFGYKNDNSATAVTAFQQGAVGLYANLTLQF